MTVISTAPHVSKNNIIYSSTEIIPSVMVVGSFCELEFRVTRRFLSLWDVHIQCIIYPYLNHTSFVPILSRSIIVNSTAPGGHDKIPSDYSLATFAVQAYPLIPCTYKVPFSLLSSSLFRLISGYIQLGNECFVG